MGVFDITRARQQLGFTPSTSAYANIDVRTGGGDVGRAIGQGVLELGAKYELKQANTELSEYQRKVGMDDVVMWDEISRELDPAKHDEIFKRHMESRKSFAPKNRRASQAATILDNQTAPERFTKLLDAKKKRVDDNFDTEILMDAVVLSTNGDPDLYREAQKKLARGYIIDKNDQSETGRPLDKSKYAMFNTKLKTAFMTGSVNVLISSGQYKEANDLIDKSDFTPDQKISLKKDISSFKRESEVAFTNELNDMFIKADESNMSSIQLRQQANDFRELVKANPLLDGAAKTSLLKAVKTWEKDEGSINYSVINSLNQRIDQYIQSGVVDVTLKEDIVKAKLDGSFGSRKGVVSRDSMAMIKRLDAAEYKTNYTATAGIRAKFKDDVSRYPNAEEMEYLFDKDVREELSTKEMNDAEAILFTKTRATWYRNLSEKQAGELTGIRATGKGVVPWSELPRSEQERDLHLLYSVDVPRWMLGKTELKYGWAKKDIQKAQEIWKGESTVTNEMIKEFSDYLTTEGRVHFKAGEKMIIIPSGEAGNAQYEMLPSKTVFYDSNGKKWTKP